MSQINMPSLVNQMYLVMSTAMKAEVDSNVTFCADGQMCSSMSVVCNFMELISSLSYAIAIYYIDIVMYRYTHQVPDQECEGENR